LTFKDDVVAVNFNHILWLDEAGEAASVGIAEKRAGVDHKVA